MIFEKIEFSNEKNIFGPRPCPTFGSLLMSQKYGKTKTGQRIIFKEISLESEKNLRKTSKKLGHLHRILKVIKEKEHEVSKKSRYVRAYTPTEMKNEGKNSSIFIRTKVRTGRSSHRCNPKPSGKTLKVINDETILGWD